MMDPVMVLREALGWLSLLPMLAGVVVCSLHLGRSRWVGVLLAGFAGEAAIAAFYRVTSLFIGRGLVSYTSLGIAYLFSTVLGIAASVAIVAGIWGLLTDGVSGAARRPGDRPASSF
jgi:hypothetical protein